MLKTIGGLLGISKNVNRGHALKIAAGITMMVLMMAGGAGATKIIIDNATGGACASFGTWAAAKKTCTMTSDVTGEAVQIDVSGMTLDGNGHKITAYSASTDAVYLNGRSDVTVKNLNIGRGDITLDASNNNYFTNINFSEWGGFSLDSSNNNTLTHNIVNKGIIGIDLFQSNNNIVTDNAASNNTMVGIYLSSSNGNLIKDNIANSNSKTGIYILSSDNNIITDNSASNNGATSFDFGNHVGVGLSLWGNNNIVSNNDFNSNTGVGIDMTYVFNNTITENNVVNNTLGIGMSSTTNTTISRNNLSNSRNYVMADESSGNGIYAFTYNNFKDYNIISDNIVNSNDKSGIVLYSHGNKLVNNTLNSNKINGIVVPSSKNTLINNNANSNGKYGIVLGSETAIYFDSNNTLIGNNADSNVDYGFYIVKANNNWLSGNNASNNYYGIYVSSSINNTISAGTFSSNPAAGVYLSYSNDTKVFHNNFINNPVGYIAGTNNSWDSGYPSGGNYWDDYIGADGNNDGIGDTPYSIGAGAQDRYPFMQQNGWISSVPSSTPTATPTATPPPASTQLIDVSDEIGDVSRPDIDIVRVTINKDADVYTSQITVNGTIDTNNAQYSITWYDNSMNMNRYKIEILYNANSSNANGIYENTSVLFENTSLWVYNKIRDVQVSANGNILNIIADFSGIDLSACTIRKAGSSWYAPDKITLLEKDTVDLTSTAIPTPTPTPTTTAIPPSGTVISISNATTTQNSNVTLPIMINNVNNVAAGTIMLTYDPNVVNVLSVSGGDLGSMTAGIDNATGKVNLTAFSTTAKSGSVTFASVLLNAIGSINASSPLSLSVSSLADPDGNAIPYAVQSGTFTITSVINGDTNNDGQVTIVDALFVAQYTVGMKTLSASQLAAADVNHDGMITIVDALFMAQYTVGLRQL